MDKDAFPIKGFPVARRLHELHIGQVRPLCAFNEKVVHLIDTSTAADFPVQRGYRSVNRYDLTDS